MEYHNGHGFFEEILSLTNESSIPFQFFDNNTLFDTSSSLQDLSFFDPQTLNFSPFGQHFNHPFVDHHQLSSAPHHHAPNIKLESPPLFQDQDYSVISMLEDVQNCHFVHDVGSWLNPEMPDPGMETGGPEPEMGSGLKRGRNGKSGKVEGLPSKNLMAERRRRKRLNDRLSMLRSVVPKISKMDRTSILGDTIDYMKELIEKINHMQEEIDISSNQFNLLNIFKEAKPKDIFIRNSPKFDVERRNTDTRVQVCCTGKPELLISTMSTLEALGLEIHQCVISCFNDFVMHASCSEEMEQRVILNSEDIKQALFRNAGYGGKCL